MAYIRGDTMRFIAKYDRTSYDKAGNALLQLSVANNLHKKMLEELEPGVPLSVQITKAKGKRSIEQNRYMWALIDEIDRARNGGRSSDDWAVYIEALERAGAKFERISCKAEAERMLKEQFRAVQFVRVFDDEGRNEYKCFYGSSKMNTKEMSELIDAVLDIAAAEGINTAYWEGLLT